MWRALMRRGRDDQAGVAMMIAVVLMAVIATLALTTLAVSTHSDKSTARSRHFVQALHVAESGVDRAIAAVQETNGQIKSSDCTTGATASSCSFSGTTEEGSYSVTITKLARNNYQIDATGRVREGRQLSSERALRVTIAPPRSFEAALFSFTTVETKNNDTITGDVWANDNVILASGSTVTGSITAAWGYVILRGQAHVGGDATSGKFDETTSQAFHLDQGAEIVGKVTASVIEPPDPQTCGGAVPGNYTVRLDGGASIAGGVTTWGSVDGPGSASPPIAQNTCTTAPKKIDLPTFTYSADNYDLATLHEFGTPDSPSATAVQDFQAYVTAQGGEISGTFYVNQTAPVSQDTRIDLTNVVITGDTSIITNTPIFTNNTDDSPSVTDATVLLASTYQPPVGTVCDVNQDASDCAAHIKNNFSVCNPDAPAPGTAVLVYTPFGPTAVKNNALQCGAVYADSIQIKNNQSLTYDPRIERMVGFGPVTLEIVRWLELAS